MILDYNNIIREILQLQNCQNPFPTFYINDDPVLQKILAKAQKEGYNQDRLKVVLTGLVQPTMEDAAQIAFLLDVSEEDFVKLVISNATNNDIGGTFRSIQDIDPTPPEPDPDRFPLDRRSLRAWAICSYWDKNHEFFSHVLRIFPESEGEIVNKTPKVLEFIPNNDYCAELPKDVNAQEIAAIINSTFPTDRPVIVHGDRRKGFDLLKQFRDLWSRNELLHPGVQSYTTTEALIIPHELDIDRTIYFHDSYHQSNIYILCKKEHTRAIASEIRGRFPEAFIYKSLDKYEL
jgi:hypothetical protein